MTTPVAISIDNASLAYGSNTVWSNVTLHIPQGRIVGLIGRNGAGKTSLINAILGLTASSGSINVLGFNPLTDRMAMMSHVTFISDVAILPKWMSVQQAIDVVGGLHPRFSKEKALQILSKANVPLKGKIKFLSKGMTVQLHLALIMAIDAKVLILDEPTLGLDPLYRSTFYRMLLEDYFDGEKTIIMSTHQIDEIEHVVSDVILLEGGRVKLYETAEKISSTYGVLSVPDNAAAPQPNEPLLRRGLGSSDYIVNKNLGPYADLRLPAARLSDVCCSLMQG